MGVMIELLVKVRIVENVLKIQSLVFLLVEIGKKQIMKIVEVVRRIMVNVLLHVEMELRKLEKNVTMGLRIEMMENVLGIVNCLLVEMEKRMKKKIV
jgi:hypothetical protein